MSISSGHHQKVPHAEVPPRARGEGGRRGGRARVLETDEVVEKKWFRFKFSIVLINIFICMCSLFCFVVVMCSLGVAYGLFVFFVCILFASLVGRLVGRTVGWSARWQTKSSDDCYFFGN